MAETQDKAKQIRDEMVKQLIEAIEKNPQAWERGWFDLTGSVQINGKTGKPYRGFNAFYLSLTRMFFKYEDPRWVTFNQAHDLGATVKKGEKSSPVIFYELYDSATKKEYDEKSVDGMTAEERAEYLKENVYPVMKYSRVFNAEQCENFPAREIKEMPEEERQNQNELIEMIITNSAAPISYDGGNRAYYSPSSDSIHLPAIAAFSSMEDYYATALHEIAHSTGHESRLNRDLSGDFGSTSYAIEELRAEIASVFMQNEFGIELNGSHIENHAAYLSSWLEAVKKDYSILYKAAADAQRISDYVAEHYMTSVREEAAEQQQERAGEHEKENEAEEASAPIFSRELPFSAQVDAVLNGTIATDSHVLVMPHTPFLLRQVGLDNLPIVMRLGKLRSIMRESKSEDDNNHNLSPEMVKEIPVQISNPIMIMDSKTHPDTSVILVTEIVDNSNRPVIVALELNKQTQKGTEMIEANLLASAYGKKDFQVFLENNIENILYWDKQKTQEMSVSSGLRLPSTLTNLESDIIIRKAAAFVNRSATNSSNISENTEKTVEETPYYDARADIEAEKASIEREAEESIRREENMQAQLQQSIQEWYATAFPTDELAAAIDPAATFSDLHEAIQEGKDIYQMLASDSLVRERAFSQLADIEGISYDDVYARWENGSREEKIVKNVFCTNFGGEYRAFLANDGVTIEDLCKGFAESPYDGFGSTFGKEIPWNEYQEISEKKQGFDVALLDDINSYTIKQDGRVIESGHLGEMIWNYKKIAIFGIEHHGESRYYRANAGETIESLTAIYASDPEHPMVAMAVLGTRISEAEFAEIQQGKWLDFSLEINADKQTFWTTIDGQNFETRSLEDIVLKTPANGNQSGAVPATQWFSIKLPEGAVGQEYGSNTLIRMPQDGEYGKYAIFIPTKLLRTDEEGTVLRATTENIYRLKNDGLQVDLTADELQRSFAGETIGKEAVRVAPSKRVRESLARVEQNVPPAMKALPNWCCYKTRWNEERGKRDKYLYSAVDGKQGVKRTEPSEWTTFEAAMKFAKENNCEGLSFAFDGKSGITCIDLDRCVNPKTGEQSAFAAQLVAAMQDTTYIERSASGSGLHIFVKDDILKGGQYKNVASIEDEAFPKAEMEVYDKNFIISFTGNMISAQNTLSKCSVEAMANIRGALGERKQTTAQTTTGQKNEYVPGSDSEVIDRIRRSKRGAEFDRLYSGEGTLGDRSRDDMKLAGILAFFTNGDKEQCLRIMKNSGLYRADKLDEYYAHTIEKAIGNMTVLPTYGAGSAPQRGNGKGGGNSR